MEWLSAASCHLPSSNDGKHLFISTPKDEHDGNELFNLRGITISCSESELNPIMNFHGDDEMGWWILLAMQ